MYSKTEYGFISCHYIFEKQKFVLYWNIGNDSKGYQETENEPIKRFFELENELYKLTNFLSA